MGYGVQCQSSTYCQPGISKKGSDVQVQHHAITAMLFDQVESAYVKRWQSLVLQEPKNNKILNKSARKKLG